jgi:hypothetical protein
VLLEAQCVDIQKAAEDVRARTLSKIPRLLDRLLYLSSLRDYNSGLYYHEGLADQFGPEIACQALADCHRAVCRELLFCSLEDLVQQIVEYMESSQTRSADFVSVWKHLEPYRAAVPVQTEQFSAEFLFSNLRIALVIVEERMTLLSRPDQAHSEGSNSRDFS